MNFNPSGLLMRVLRRLDHLLIDLFSILKQCLHMGNTNPTTYAEE